MADGQPLFFEDRTSNAPSPYFSLSNVSNVLSPDALVPPSNKNRTTKEVWGLAARMDDDKQAQFLLGIMKHAGLTVDERVFQKVANEWGIAATYTVYVYVSLRVLLSSS